MLLAVEHALFNTMLQGVKAIKIWACQDLLTTVAWATYCVLGLILPKYVDFCDDNDFLFILLSRKSDLGATRNTNQLQS